MAQPDGKVLCTCLNCRKNSFIMEGITYHGLYIHPRNRRKHLVDASKNANKDFAKSLIQLSLKDFPDLVEAKQPLTKSPSKQNAEAHHSESNNSSDEEYKPLSI
jgi:hypothetical protein